MTYCIGSGDLMSSLGPRNGGLIATSSIARHSPRYRGTQSALCLCHSCSLLKPYISLLTDLPLLSD